MILVFFIIFCISDYFVCVHMYTYMHMKTMYVIINKNNNDSYFITKISCHRLHFFVTLWVYVPISSFERD